MDPPDDYAAPAPPVLHWPFGWLAATALLALPTVVLIILRLVVDA
jgi:hypothetical protein